mgnify:CR=1 FL=1
MRRVLSALLSLTPFYVALACGMVVILLTGGNPLETYFYLGREAFGSWSQLQATMVSSTALLFTATATAIGFRAGVFTLAAEGAFISGGLTAAVFGSQVLSLPAPLGIPVLLVLSAVAGALVALIPALLKAYLGVDEVVSTLMFNFVTAGIVIWLVQRFFIAPKEANSATRFILPAYELPTSVLGVGVPLGFFIGIVAVIAYALPETRRRGGPSAPGSFRGDLGGLFGSRAFVGYVLCQVLASAIIFAAVEALPGDACTASLQRDAVGVRLENCRRQDERQGDRDRFQHPSMVRPMSRPALMCVNAGGVQRCFFARPAKGFFALRMLSRIGTPGMPKSSRRRFTRKRM